MSTTALDTTRERVATAGAAALVRASVRRATPVVQALCASHPRGGPGDTTTSLDGHPCASTAQRREALRAPWAAPLPGPALVVLEQPRLVLPEVCLAEEGHAQQRRGSAQGLSRVSAGDGWIADRTWCPRGLLCGIARRGAACLVRQHAPVPGELLGPPTRHGVTRRGTVSAQARLGADPVRGETRPVRRLTLARKAPTRDGATALPRLPTLPAPAARARPLVGGLTRGGFL